MSEIGIDKKIMERGRKSRHANVKNYLRLSPLLFLLLFPPSSSSSNPSSYLDNIKRIRHHQPRT